MYLLCSQYQNRTCKKIKSVKTLEGGGRGRQAVHIRDLKIVVYDKRLTSDTLLAIKTKSLTVKYITYRVYSKYRKLRIDLETPCLTTETWRLILNDFLLK